MRHKQVFLVFIAYLPLALCDQRVQQNPIVQQPRILTQDGNMVFQTGENHNISFQASGGGGAVYIAGHDVKRMAEKVIENNGKITQLESLSSQVQANQRGLAAARQSLSSHLTVATTRYNTLNRKIRRFNSTLEQSAPIRTIKRRFRSLRNRVTDMERLLTVDNCEGDPCLHGGTCIDMYDRFKCFCPPNWIGGTCNEDLNECQVYAGTPNGCQNGASCINTNGGFSCHCPSGYSGVLCNLQTSGCEGSDAELCGHGKCVSSGPGERHCICDNGWGLNSEGECTSDVDECQGRTNPCHDLAQCINVDGSYICGNCPRGYTGDGHSCRDINECEYRNGGCSTNPMVECINSPGGSSCGQCPSGYSGNGQICIWIGVCGINNGGCNQNADCLEVPGIPRICRCKPGYQGSGEGVQGCTATGGEVTPTPQPCDPNPCANGVCHTSPNSGAYTCECNEGWSGLHCDQDIDECGMGVCRNNAQCNNTLGNYTCQCDEFHTGRNCEQPTFQCGGQLSGETGSLRFPPGEHDFYPFNQSCAWRITAGFGKIIRATFPLFNLETHSSCSYDFLEIHDGPTASSNQIGKYCGTQLENQTISSSHNQMYLWFKSDASLTGAGFHLTWVTADPICGGDIRDGNSGTVTSPGYPGHYPPNRVCVWTIAVTPGQNIFVSFTAMSLEHHNNCSYDYVEFRNGLRDTDPVIERLCTSVGVGHITTEGNELYIKFRSDGSVTDQGFSLNWHNVSTANPQCGGAIEDTDGLIQSPNYPQHYDENGDCVWTITVPEGQRIMFNFTDIDMEQSNTCAFDYVQIHDGSSDADPLFARYCGSSTPAPIISSGRHLYIRFHSDDSVGGRGFQAVYTVACGGTFTDPTGVLTSPFWPEHYPNEKTCTYVISAPSDKAVRVTFSHFQIEADVEDEDVPCAYDYLAAYDGEAATNPLLRRMCGSSVPPPLISTGSSMFLVFHTDESLNDLGFRAVYDFVVRNSSGCGGVITADTGSITSPGHPNSYPHGVDCLWEIRVTPGFQIRFTFGVFSLEYTDSCQYDYVQVSSDANTTAAHKYCGTTMPPIFTSDDNVLYVRFKADSSIAFDGFTANWVAFNHTWCGDELRSLPGVITSPGYPANYPHQRECIWTIIAPDNHQVQLNITDFSMESHRDCNYDYLEIRNGGFSTSPLVGTFCGLNITTPIRSHSNRLWIKFKSDGSASARGFRIWYEDYGEGCGADLTSPSGMFLSPNYPSPYGRNAECFWTITVAQGSAVVLVFIDLDIEVHANCAYDYVEAIDGRHAGPSLGRFCGNTLPHPVESTGNQMTVKFRTDYSMSGAGFHAAYFADCQDRVLNAHSGVIESPNFPFQYPHNRNCSWTIQVPRGNVIGLRFSHFQMEDSSAGEICRNDYMEIHDGEAAGSSDLLATHCGSLVPPPLNSSSNVVRIRFKSDASIAHNGFRLEYTTIGCGGDLSGESGQFHSPNYPNRYPHNRECVWRIEVPVGKRINLTLLNVDLEFHSNCSYDYLEILGGREADAPLISKICQNHNDSYNILSSSNHMYVKFKTDISSGGTGFLASWTAVTGGCGGVFTTPTGNINSPGSPNAYPHNIDCEWNITVEEFQTVQFNFKTFDLEEHDDCIYDSVTLYDGLEAESPVLAKLCGSQLNRTVYSSTSNKMRVRMVTDGSSAARGFTASYITACGGRKIVGDEVGVIRSPNYPLPYNGNTDCVWTLMGAQAVDRITLQFTHMELESSDQNACSHDYVKVLQGEDSSSPEHDSYCGTDVPASITSLGNALTIVFHSDNSVQLSGFSASYSRSTSFCGGNFTSQSGAFSTPGYPNNYPGNAECVWIINGSPGNNIQLSFQSMDLEDTDTCNRDYVEVRDGTNLNNVLGRFCGSTVPSNPLRASSLFIKFRSDMLNGGQGFMAEFSTMTGGDLVGNTGQLSSPLYPSMYPHNADYTWTIIVDNDLKVKIDFVTMDIEANGCAYDYVEFYDGRDLDSVKIGRFCGTVLPPTFTSTANMLTVVFKSDISGRGRGFLFNWSAVSNIITTPGTTLTPPVTPTGCSFELTATDNAANVSSPDYPGNYGWGLTCEWVIRSASGERIQLTLTDMDIEYASGCSFDQLSVSDGFSGADLSGPLCGRLTSGVRTFTSSGGVMRLLFRTDGSVQRRGFLAEYKSTCGGRLTEVNGLITSPGSPNVYPLNSNCTWIISVVRGRTVELSFNNFNLPSSGSAGQECSGDRLKVLNGQDETSPPILTNNRTWLCGSNQPPSVISSASNFLYVQFVSDGSQDSSSSGFSLAYREKQLDCGGNFIVSHDQPRGIFVSPKGDDGNYLHNVDCTWIITAPATERVQLDFNSFDLEKHNDCLYDYLLVQDGGTEHSPQLSRLCGTEAPSVRSTGNVISVRLVTDNSVSGGGFNISYSIATCGGTLTAPNGTITSPNFPSSYPNSITCEWYINAPIGHFLTFNFSAFNLGAAGNNCSGDVDRLSLYDLNRHGNTSSKISDLCGPTPPTPVTSADSKAYVKFVSNGVSASSGFSMNYFSSVEVCGGQLTTPSGRFTTPNFPGQYPHSRTCYWYITVPVGRRVTLTFEQFFTEDQTNCLFDYAEIFNGHLDESPKIGRYCGNLTTHTVKSSGNKAMVSFTSDGSVTAEGFQIAYTSDEPAVCGGEIPASPGSAGTIVSPGYSTAVDELQHLSLSGRYPNSTQCEWVVHSTPPGNSSIVLEFMDAMWELETDGECRYDFLQIREGTDADGGLVGQFCGNSTNNMKIAMPTAAVWMVFISDSSVSHGGFNFTYRVNPCGGVFTQRSGVLTTPNYPSNYDHNSGCAWLITVPEGQQIVLTIDHMDLETHHKCDYDKLHIFNGPYWSSPKLATICEANNNTEYHLASNNARLEFLSDFSNSRPGFQVSWSTRQQGCGGIFNAQTGRLTTPNSPGNYPHNVECIWDIIVQEGYHIVFSFEGIFDIESGSGGSCAYDYVQLTSVANDGSLTDLGSYCSNVAPAPISSLSNRLRVKFRSDPWTHGTGFIATWMAGCGGQFNQDTGMIFSPGFPSNYGSNLTCDYYISASENQFVVLQFDDSAFDIEPGSLCQYDALSVYNYNTTGALVGKFCGTTAPQSLSTKGQMLLRFTSDADTTFTGWRVNYVKSDCGGIVVNTTSGEIKSPTHPVDYHNNLDCNWTITVSANRSISVKFEEFDVESSSNGNCDYDYVAFYDGLSADAPLIGRYCGNVLPSTIKTRSNSMTVRFKTDSSVTKGGFRARYTETYGVLQGCGGTLNTSSGSIAPVRTSDGTYVNDLDCEWVIMVPDNNVIAFDVTNINIEFGSGCEYDGLELFDGLSASDIKYNDSAICGVVNSVSWQSSTNVARVRFFSDHSVQNTGFSLTYSSRPALCGGVITVNETGEIMSPNFGSAPTTAPVRCRWTLGAANREKQIRVTVTEIGLPQSDTCDQDYLLIRDQPYITSAGPAQQFYLCGNTPVAPIDSQGRDLQLTYQYSGQQSSGYRGFKLTYSIATCNRTYSQADGLVRSPGWPSVYPPQLNCFIEISVPDPSHRITLYFSTFIMEFHSNCTYDYLEVLEGGNSLSGRLCGVTKPRPVTSVSNSITLHMVTDGSVLQEGFEITYVASPSGCGGRLTSPSGAFESHVDVPASTSCVWVIEVSSRLRPVLNFPTMDLRSNATSCTDSYVQVRNGDSSAAPLMGTFCNDIPNSLVASSNKLYVEFVSTSGLTNGGSFSAQYSTSASPLLVLEAARPLSLSGKR